VRLLTLALLIPALAPAQWKFAVSGDSRNCGDIVMPAIAAGVKASGAEFYWHLGDFRAIYEFDEDMVPPAHLNVTSKPLSISDYEARAWPDFIEHQLGPFGNLPIHLALGNHETIPPATREKVLLQFADWFDAPAVREQRLKDNPADHMLRSYYHWVQRGIDFITLDNASPDQFDTAQLQWFKRVLDADEKSAEIRSVVVGMHAALPGSFGMNHSMSDWAQGQESGRQVYQELLHARNAAHKNVYILSSHSHFYMPDVYRTKMWEGKVLPGWIIGTAGAVRYRLPEGAAPPAKTNVYGYMVADVATDGQITFSFIELSITDIERALGSYPPALVDWCYNENHQ
jgi:Calcineurin-like phosphoesterase